MPYIGKKPENIIATAVDSTTGTFSGAVSAASVDADGGVTVDNITIDGTEIDLSSGDLTIDVAGDIILDADGGDVSFRDAGTGFLAITNSSNDAVIHSVQNDKDMIFTGTDGGSTIEAMRIDMSGGGLVGINTNSPSTRLHVYQASGNTALRVEAAATNAQASINFKNDARRYDVGINSSDSFFISDDTASSTRLTIDSSGRLFLGTTSVAASNIHTTLAGSNSSTDVSSGNGAALSLKNTDTTNNNYSTLFFENSAGGIDSAIYGIHGDADGTGTSRVGTLVFATAASGGGVSEAMRIQPDGTLSINSTSDTDAKLYVLNNDAQSVGFFQSGSNSNQDIRAISTSLNQNAANTDCQHLRSTTQNVGTFRLDGNGASTFTSDERLKKNIETARDGYLEDLDKLRVVKYNWHCHDEVDKKELGLIAQEVQKVFPKLVVEDNVELNGIEKPLAVKLSVLPMMLLKALQEANTKITALEARITALENV